MALLDQIEKYITVLDQFYKSKNTILNMYTEH
jgi:hypothetical protein